MAAKTFEFVVPEEDASRHAKRFSEFATGAVEINRIDGVPTLTLTTEDPNGVQALAKLHGLVSRAASANA